MGKQNSIEHIVCQPELLYTLSSAEFVELIAHLFRREGYTVEPNGRSQDIVAHSQNGSQARHLIDCKRYAVGRRVEPGALRDLLDRSLMQGATGGIMITTGSFSRLANKVLAENSKLEGIEFEELVRRIQAVCNLE